MTYKVQKIREKVVEIVNSTNPFIPDEDGKNSDYEAGKLDAATQILQIIDSLEEPVSEDLEEAAVEWFNSIKYKSDLSGTQINAFKDGAKWKEEQFEKNRLKHCNSITNEQAELEQGFIDQHLDKHQRMPTFLDAIEYGMRLQKEQLIKDATEVTVHIDAGGYPYIPQIELYDYDKDVPLAKEGDRYKVILIKEG